MEVCSIRTKQKALFTRKALSDSSTSGCRSCTPELSSTHLSTPSTRFPCLEFKSPSSLLWPSLLAFFLSSVRPEPFIFSPLILCWRSPLFTPPLLPIAFFFNSMPLLILACPSAPLSAFFSSRLIFYRPVFTSVSSASPFLHPPLLDSCVLN